MRESFKLDSGWIIDIEDNGYKTWSVTVKRSDGVTIDSDIVHNIQEVTQLTRKYGKLPGKVFDKFKNKRSSKMKQRAENARPTIVKIAGGFGLKVNDKIVYEGVSQQACMSYAKTNNITGLIQYSDSFSNGQARATQEIANKLGKVENSLSTIKSDFKSSKIDEQQAIKEIVKDQNRRNSAGMEDSPHQMIKKWKVENAEQGITEEFMGYEIIGNKDGTFSVRDKNNNILWKNGLRNFILAKQYIKELDAKLKQQKEKSDKQREERNNRTDSGVNRWGQGRNAVRGSGNGGSGLLWK